MEGEYSAGWNRKDVHGTDPQFLIEKILRERIYESVYWKEKMFGVNAEIMVDRGSELTCIGGANSYFSFRSLWKSETNRIHCM